MARPIWTELRSVQCALTALVAAIVLGGCATNKEQLLPHGEATMLDVWEQETGRSGSRHLLDARQSLRRPLTAVDVRAVLAERETYSRTAANEITRQFKRLPNPDLVMYVFPHLAGSERVPVPGYSTVFPLHARVHYALPGERTQDY
jgi:conjugative transfer region lipoprotein (TIGR03751 family)